MKLSLYWVDAFTLKPFHGNPAGVVPLDQWLPDEVMQRIAFERTRPAFVSRRAITGAAFCYSGPARVWIDCKIVMVTLPILFNCAGIN